MADKFYLQWNLTNWVTVTLMALSAMLFVGFVASAIRHYNGVASTQTAVET